MRSPFEQLRQPPRSGAPGRLSVLSTQWAVVTVIFAALLLMSGSVGGYPYWVSIGAGLVIVSNIPLFWMGGAGGAFSPIPLALVGCVLYTIPFALTVATGGVVTYGRADLIHGAGTEKAVWLFTVALASLVAGALWRSPSGSPRKRGIFRQDETLLKTAWRRYALGVVGFAAVAVGLMALYALIGQLGGGALIASLEYGRRYDAFRGMGPLRSGVHLLTVGAACLYAAALTGRHTRVALWSLMVPVAALVSWLVLVQTRGPLVRVIVVLLCLRHILRGRIHVAILSTITVVVGLVGIYVGLWRGGFALDDLELLRDRAYIVNPANSEFGAPLLTTAEIVRHFPAEYDFRMGASYLTVPGNMIPLAIWPDRPQTVAEWYGATFYPEEWAQGGGFGFSPVAEAYLNFATPGVILTFIALGALLALLERWLADLRPRPVVVLGYALFAPWILQFMRLDLAAVAKGFVILNLIPMLVLLLAARGVARLRV